MIVLGFGALLSALAVIAAYLTEWGPFSIYHPEDMPLQTPPEPQNTPTNDVQPANDNSPGPTVPESETGSMLDTFCTALRDYEGEPGDLNYRNNNPGNTRCSPVGYASKYGKVKCVNNFAVFPTYELGWEYLENLVRGRVIEHPEWTFLDFFENYAPANDNNFPKNYAAYVAERCEATVDTKLSDLLA